MSNSATTKAEEYLRWMRDLKELLDIPHLRPYHEAAIRGAMGLCNDAALGEVKPDNLSTLCVCGHGYLAHGGTTGCWAGMANGTTCSCHLFRPKE